MTTMLERSSKRKIDISNQNVKAAAAAFDQARALVAEARAGFWPTDRRQRRGAAAAAAPASTTSTAAGVPVTASSRRTITIQRGTSRATGTSTSGARFAARPKAIAPPPRPVPPRSPRRGCPRRRQLATDYFELRAQDQLQRLLDDTVVAETSRLKITESRYKFGVAARADVVSAQTQLLVEPGAAGQREDPARRCSNTPSPC